MMFENNSIYLVSLSWLQYGSQCRVNPIAAGYGQAVTSREFITVVKN